MKAQFHPRQRALSEIHENCQILVIKDGMKVELRDYSVVNTLASHFLG